MPHQSKAKAPPPTLEKLELAKKALGSRFTESKWLGYLVDGKRASFWDVLKAGGQG